jgi:hypothetical protein
MDQIETLISEIQRVVEENELPEGYQIEINLYSDDEKYSVHGTRETVQ